MIHYKTTFNKIIFSKIPKFSIILPKNLQFNDPLSCVVKTVGQEDLHYILILVDW